MWTAESSSPLVKSGTCLSHHGGPWISSETPRSALRLLQELVKRLKRSISKFNLKHRMTAKQIYMNVWSEEFWKDSGGGSRGDRNYSKALTQMLKQMHVGQEGGWAKGGRWGTSWHKGKARVSRKTRVGMAGGEGILWALGATGAEDEDLPSSLQGWELPLSAQGELSLLVWWEKVRDGSGSTGWREPDLKRLVSWTGSWIFSWDGDQHPWPVSMLCWLIKGWGSLRTLSALPDDLFSWNTSKSHILARSVKKAVWDRRRKPPFIWKSG